MSIFDEIDAARAHTADMNQRKAVAEQWCGALGKVFDAHDADVAALRAELAETKDALEKAQEARDQAGIGWATAREELDRARPVLDAVCVWVNERPSDAADERLTRVASVYDARRAAEKAAKT